MDSKLIFESSKIYISKIIWEKANFPDSEWSSISLDSSLGVDQVIFLMGTYFDTDILHVSIGRENSFTTNKNLIMNQIKSLIHQISFKVWNEDFTKIIEFNKIGVFRNGKSHS